MEYRTWTGSTEMNSRGCCKPFLPVSGCLLNKASPADQDTPFRMIQAQVARGMAGGMHSRKPAGIWNNHPVFKCHIDLYRGWKRKIYHGVHREHREDKLMVMDNRPRIYHEYTNSAHSWASDF